MNNWSSFEGKVDLLMHDGIHLTWEADASFSEQV